MSGGASSQVTTAGFFRGSEYKKHNNTVRVLAKNTINNNYLSLDQAGVRIWETGHDGHCTDVHRVDFPKTERGFISCVIFVPSLRVYFGACLDMTIQVFDIDFKFLQAVPTGQRSVLCLDYDIATNEIISAGIDVRARSTFAVSAFARVGALPSVVCMLRSRSVRAPSVLAMPGLTVGNVTLGCVIERA